MALFARKSLFSCESWGAEGEDEMIWMQSAFWPLVATKYPEIRSLLLNVNLLLSVILLLHLVYSVKFPSSFTFWESFAFDVPVSRVANFHEGIKHFKNWSFMMWNSVYTTDPPEGSFWTLMLSCSFHGLWFNLLLLRTVSKKKLFFPW